MAPKTMHEGVAQLAILLLPLPTAVETDLLLVKRPVLLQNCSMAVLAQERTRQSQSSHIFLTKMTIALKTLGPVALPTVERGERSCR
jgi:hypothetical protein